MFYKASRDGITTSIFFKCEWQVTQVTICFISPHHTVGKVKEPSVRGLPHLVPGYWRKMVLVFTP